MKLWIDDVRPAPEGYIWCKSTNEALRAIIETKQMADKPRMYDCNFSIEVIDLDHDAGEYVQLGGDYINVLKEMERLYKRYNIDFSHIKIRLHSANPVGVQNMRAIIQKNSWKEIQ